MEVSRPCCFGEYFTGTMNRDRVVSEEIVRLGDCSKSFFFPQAEKPE